jgi:hypothetical protein
MPPRMDKLTILSMSFHVDYLRRVTSASPEYAAGFLSSLIFMEAFVNVPDGDFK